jgi:hypothetical protein
MDTLSPPHAPTLDARVAARVAATVRPDVRALAA